VRRNIVKNMMKTEDIFDRREIYLEYEEKGVLRKKKSPNQSKTKALF